MLKKFRTIARSLASKILMGLLILTFAVWGIEDMVRSSGGNVSVATVGDLKISQIEFQRALYYETERMRKILGKQFSPEIVKYLGLEQKALQRLVDNRLLVLESKKLGIRVSDAEVANNIRTNPIFIDDKGKFNRKYLEATLRANGQVERDYVEQIREDTAVKLLLETISSVATVPENAPPVLLAARDERRNVDIYSIPTSLIKSVATPSEEQLKKYYDSHSDKFTAPEYRIISYIAFTADDAKKSSRFSHGSDHRVLGKDIETLYHERIDEFKKPEQRNVERLIFANEADASKAYDAIKNGKSFEQIGKEFTILNPKAISLGVVDKSGIIEAAADKVFSLNILAVSEPINSPFGWHIFRVLEIIPATVKPLDEVRPFLEKELEQKDNEQILIDFSNSLEDSIAGGSTLAEVAKEFNIKIVTLPPVDKSGAVAGGAKEATIPSEESFLEVAFKTEEKTESPIITGKNSVNYIIRIDSIAPAHVIEFEKIKPKVIAEWTTEEKRKQLSELSKKITVGLATPSTRADTIKTYSLPYPTSLVMSQKDDKYNDKHKEQKLPPSMVKAIFALPSSSATTAFALYEYGGDGYAIAVVKEIIPVKHDEKDSGYTSTLSDIRKEYSNSAQNEIIEQYMRLLAAKYPVSINYSLLKTDALRSN